MRLATTTGDFRLYCNCYADCIRHVCDAGFRYIDLDMYTVDQDDALLIRADWRETAAQLKADVEMRGAAFVQAHAPGGNPLVMDAQYEQLLRTTIRSIEVCGALGIPNIVVHAGMLPGIAKTESFRMNRAFFEQLFPAMEKTGVCVLCENSTKVNMGDMYFTNSGADMLDFISYVGHPLFHACWDTGHANAEGSQYEEIVTLGKDLYAVHIHDNRGSQDEHLIPFLGTINMDEVMQALLTIGYSGYFTFEATSTLRSQKYWLGDRRPFHSPSGMEAHLADPPLFMQDALEKLLYETGVYLLRTYHCFEE